MIACALVAAPKLRPPAGMPPTTPGSAVSVSRSMIPSSAATLDTPSGMPMPRLTTLLGCSSSAARRAMILRSDIGMAAIDEAGTRISPENAALYGSPNVCMWYSGFSATTTQSTRIPGIFTCRGLSDPRSAMRSTCTMTMPPELRAAIAIARPSSVSASRLHRDVAVGIGGGAADHADVDRKGAIEKVLLVAQRHERDEILGGRGVDLAAAVARIDERAEPHPRQVSRLARRDVAEQMRDHALRQVVRLDLIADRERLQLRHEAPVTADHAFHEPRVAEVIEAAILAVALACSIDERQVARTADALRIVFRGVDEAVLERDGDVLGETDADEARRGDGVAIRESARRLRAR